MDILKEATEFYRENAKLVDEKKRVYEVKASDYKKFFKKQGVTEDIMKKITEVETAMVNGANTVLAEKLVEAIADAKKSGDDPKDIKITMKTRTAQGRNMQTMETHRRYPSPRNPGQHVDCYGVVTLRVTQDRLLDNELLKKAEEAVRNAL